MRILFKATCLLTMLAVSSGVMAADPETGKTLATAQCRTCHGLDGIAQIPIAPHLAGENRIYLETQLKAFRSGKREHEIMSVIAKTLTDEEISDLAAWYESIEITATLPASSQ